MAEAETDNEPKRRAQRALHRFTEQLHVEVQEAVDAARGRRLAPFESIERRCEYLLARYLTPVQGRALPKQLLRKPAGLTVTADLAAGLKAVEPHVLDACVRQIHAAVEMLKPFDGKPFGRKPIGSAAGHKTVSEEDKALERLEQAGSDLVQLFRGAVESLAAEIPASSKKRAAKPDDKSPNVLTPPQLAKEWGVDVDKIYAFIRSNELRATEYGHQAGRKSKVADSTARMPKIFSGGGRICRRHQRRQAEAEFGRQGVLLATRHGQLLKQCGVIPLRGVQDTGRKADKRQDVGGRGRW